MSRFRTPLFPLSGRPSGRDVAEVLYLMVDEVLYLMVGEASYSIVEDTYWGHPPQCFRCFEETGGKGGDLGVEVSVCGLLPPAEVY